MKTYCKDVKLTDPHYLVKAISLCFIGKLHEPEFQNLLVEYGGIARDKMAELVAMENPAIFSDAYFKIAEEISRRIERRELNISPITYFWHRDGRQGKLRLLGKETAMHQCMDYIAVESLMPLFNAKIMHMQCASVPGRGQVYGKKLLEKWVQRDPKNNSVYIQTDIKQCYKSLSPEKILALLKRDIGKNKELLWFLDSLLSMFEHGLSIGSYLSQWLCNYALSYACHFLHEQCVKIRKHKDGTEERVRLFSHAVMYMDDAIITGTSKRDLKMAVRKFDKYLQKELGVELKPGWCAKYTDKEPIDTMGFCVGRYATTIRGRVFLRARRILIRAWRKRKRISLQIAQRIVSYAGWFLHSNSKRAIAKYHLTELLTISKRIVSEEDKINAGKSKICNTA